jgi:hypothetical protein
MIKCTDCKNLQSMPFKYMRKNGEWLKGINNLCLKGKDVDCITSLHYCKKFQGK